MKKIYIKVLFASLLISFSSCMHILDTTPSNQMSSGDMWKTEDQANKGVNAVYQSLRNPIYSDGLVGSGVWLGYYGYEALGMTGQTRLNAGNLFSQSATAGNNYFSTTWKNLYNGIHRANDAVFHLPNVQMSDEKRERLIAESRILRCFFYSKLNELFGRGMGVPLYTEPVAPQDCFESQTPESEIWDFIIEDLTKAINTPSLPDMAELTSGRVSKGTAYALRGRAYLLRSQSQGVDFYDQAISDFQKVESMGYELYPDYEQMFKPAHQNNREILMTVQNIQETVGSAFGSALQKYAAPFQAGSKDSRGCWTDLQITPAIVDLYEVVVDDNEVKPFNWDDIIPGYNNMTYDERQVYFLRDYKKDGEELYPKLTSYMQQRLEALKAGNSDKYLPEGNEERIKKAYENRDPRLNISVITPYSTFKGVNDTSTDECLYMSRWPSVDNAKYYCNQPNSESQIVGLETTLNANGSQYFYYMFRKFIGVGLEYDYREQNPINEPILRLADVILMKAEALVEKNKLAEAKAEVKKVRDRVGIATMDKYFANQDVARDYVRDERRREFICEGINFFDEMRWKTLHETKFNYGPKTSMQVWGGIATGQPVYTWSDYWYTWAVPRAEVEINTNLKKTPGWRY